MHLAPLKLVSQSKDGQIEGCLAIGLDACIECGCCAYVCLGKVNLLRHIRAAKAQAHPPALPPDAAEQTPPDVPPESAPAAETPPAAADAEVAPVDAVPTDAASADAAPAVSEAAPDDPVQAFLDEFAPAAEAGKREESDGEPNG